MKAHSILHQIFAALPISLSSVQIRSSKLGRASSSVSTTVGRALVSWGKCNPIVTGRTKSVRGTSIKKTGLIWRSAVKEAWLALLEFPSLLFRL